MDENKTLDLEKIAADCNVLDDIKSDIITENINRLEKYYEEDDIKR